MSKSYIGFTEALKLVLNSIRPLTSEKRSLADCLDAVAAKDIHAAVDSPSASTSLKDGYALRSEDITQASEDRPVKLALRGVAAAGALEKVTVQPHSAVRILTGGQIPLQSDVVVSEEFTRREREDLLVLKATETGRNILPRGTDVMAGEKIVAAGDRLTPGRLGLIAAAGQAEAIVHRSPRIAVIATGDEIRLPGTPIAKGQLYASNAVTLDAWCRRMGCDSTLAVVPDQYDAIFAALRDAVDACDVVLTSGGAWSGERDLVGKVLADIGWRKIFHRVRLGPGKGTGMGLVGQCTVFMLPGGPPSNLAGFLTLARPAILKMGGHRGHGLPQQCLRLQHDVRGQKDWTQAVFGTIAYDGTGCGLFRPDRQASRLKSVGHAQALLMIPEGVDHIAAGTFVEIKKIA
jgi:molybdopterin molybdotransferase